MNVSKLKTFSNTLCIVLVVMVFSSLFSPSLARSPVAPHGDPPIDVDSNAGLAGVATSGTGTAIDPYIIANRAINGSAATDCIYIGNTTAHIIIRNCTLNWTAGNGIYLWNATNIDVEACNISHCLRGVYIYGNSDNCTVSDSFVNDSTIGICVRVANESVVDNNTCLRNQYGIYLLASSNNTVSDNNCSNANPAGGPGIYAWSGCCDNNISGNQLWGNIGLDAMVMGLNSNRNVIYNNFMYGNQAGLVLTVCNNNTILFNNISASTVGVGFGGTLVGDCTFHHNAICDNPEGAWFSGSTRTNHFYANNLINNVIQAYDDSAIDDWNGTYGNGGNYWNNWTGADAFSGVLQNVPGADGIVDTPYPLDKSTPDSDDLPRLAMVNLTLPSGPSPTPTPAPAPFTYGGGSVIGPFRIEVRDRTVFFYAQTNTVNVRWSFGDGQGRTGATAYHEYAENGTYTVTMDVGELRQYRNITIGNVTNAKESHALNPDAVILCALAGIQLAVIFALPTSPDKWKLLVLSLLMLSAFEILQAAHVVGYLGWWPL